MGEVVSVDIPSQMLYNLLLCIKEVKHHKKGKPLQPCHSALPFKSYITYIRSIIRDDNATGRSIMATIMVTFLRISIPRLGHAASIFSNEIVRPG